MKLLQAMAGGEYGGAEEFFVRLAIAFHKRGVQQQLIARPNKRRDEKLHSAGIESIQLPFGGFFDWKTKRLFKSAIKSYQPDIVLTWMNRATDLCPQGNFVHVARLGNTYPLKYYKHCDYLIGNTQKIADYIVEGGFPEERVKYLPNFVQCDAREGISRATYDTPQDALLLLGLGRLHASKGFDTLIRALSYLPSAYLWIAGEGELRGELEALCKQLNVESRVRFLGWVSNTAELLLTSDIFVCSSRVEPFGNMVAEAFCAKTPVVATRSDGPVSIIRDQENGLLVTIDDASAMAKAIQTLSEQPRLCEAMVTRAYQTYQEQYSEERVINNYLDFFRRIIAVR